MTAENHWTVEFGMDQRDCFANDLGVGPDRGADTYGNQTIGMTGGIDE